ncbi:MAG TPA: molybdenum cofactor biosynthesis protein MoaE [Gemmatimonadaceae bacterium]|nr:molybdenum cofactor biosynthesis protein MoaE [Gemmatimonadaceae bacterium]
MTVRSAVVDRPIDCAALLAEVADPSTGATALFVGTVRETNLGRPVTGIEYAAYTAMAERELAAIARDTAEQYAPLRLAVEHRTGTLGLGEISIAIAAAHAHRGPAMDAMRDIIEAVKVRVPIWKREHYADGSREWVDPTAVLVP